MLSVPWNIIPVCNPMSGNQAPFVSIFSLFYLDNLLNSEKFFLPLILFQGQECIPSIFIPPRVDHSWGWRRQLAHETVWSGTFFNRLIMRLSYMLIMSFWMSKSFTLNLRGVFGIICFLIICYWYKLSLGLQKAKFE